MTVRVLCVVTHQFVIFDLAPGNTRANTVGNSVDNGVQTVPAVFEHGTLF